MQSDWSSFNANAYSEEFNSEVEFYEEIEGDRYATPPTSSYMAIRFKVKGRISANTVDGGEFAQSAQYILSIPHDESTPPIYTGEEVKVYTKNETIEGKITRTMPVSCLGKIQMYVERSVWNEKP